MSDAPIDDTPISPQAVSKIGGSKVKRQNKEDLCPRRAHAGLLKLANPDWPMRKCLEEAGFSKYTAKQLKANNLTVATCVAEAWKLEPDGHPRTLLEKTRKLLEKRLDLALAQGGQGVSMSELTRLLAVSEAHHGGGDGGPGTGDTPRQFAGRMQWVMDLSSELQRRGMLPPAEGEVVEAEVVPE